MRVACCLSSLIPPPARIVLNSSWCGIHRSAGFLEFKAITINPGGAGAQVYNLYRFTGTIEVKAIYGIFTNVANVVTLTACSWDLYDGAVSNQITSAAGTNCSGVSLNSTVLKDAVAVNALTLMDSNQVRFTEVAASSRTYQNLIINGKNATTCYIRWKCTTDANTNCQMQFACVWTCRYPGSTFGAV